MPQMGDTAYSFHYCLLREGKKELGVSGVTGLPDRHSQMPRDCYSGLHQEEQLLQPLGTLLPC